MAIKQYIAHWSGPLAERDIVFPSVPENGTEWYDTDTTNVLSRVENGVWRDYNAVMIFRGDWLPGTYQPGDVVVDGAWTMIANKETDQRPAPQPIGDPYWVSGLGSTPAWTGASGTTAELMTGQRYKPAQYGFISGARVWIVALGANFEFMVAVIDRPGTPDEVVTMNGITPTQTGWHTVIQNPDIITPTTISGFLLIVRDHSTFSTFAGNWDYLTPNNEAVPLAGEMVHARKLLSEIRVNQTDDDANDRTAELATVKPGDTISGAGILWTVISNTVVGSHVVFVISPSAQGTSSGVLNFTFTIYGATPVNYVHIVNHFSAEPAVDGLYSETGYDNIALDQDAYGTDVMYQDAAIAEDWDYVAYSG